MTVDLSIIILSYNTKDLTYDCVTSTIESLKESKINYEIIVWDNNSTDGSVERLEELTLEHPAIRLFKKKENTGFTKGNNLAVKEAGGECILFLNSDIRVIGEAVPQLYNFYNSQEKFQFMGGKLFNSNFTPQPSCGRFYSLPVAFAALFLQADKWGYSRKSPDNITLTDWVSGACVITKKQYFEALGGFSESIFMYWDEMDLFFRASKKNFRVGFYPDAHFIHHEGSSSKSRAEIMPRIFQGYILFYKNHYSSFELQLLRCMLQCKALITIAVGYILGNKDLIESYKKAYEIAQQN